MRTIRAMISGWKIVVRWEGGYKEEYIIANCQSIWYSNNLCNVYIRVFKICTIFQKLSKCEVKAWLYWNLIILLPLRFCVKSNFGAFNRSINVIFGNFRGSEFWFLVNLSNFQVLNLPKIQSSDSMKLAKMTLLDRLNLPKFHFM